MCIEQAIYPQSFKMARVIPLHKSGAITDIKNYRPISTLINLNKILEKLMYCRLNEFFESCGILSNNQFGFRRSIDMQLAALKQLNCYTIYIIH